MVQVLIVGAMLQETAVRAHSLMKNKENLSYECWYVCHWDETLKKRLDASRQ